MEEGKNRRWRPSLSQYRELEARLEEQIEGTSRIVADCDGWRAKYRDLIDEISKGNDKKVLRDHIEALECENKTLKRSNEYMNCELEMIRGTESDVTKENKELRDLVFYLKNRGLWERITNKGADL